MNLNQQWQPVSSTAYGANAVYIPAYGKKKTLEFILVMQQNYPEFKTHPALDVAHGYVKGIERFDDNHEMRVLGWQIDIKRQQWSFLYLPTADNNIRAFVTFSSNKTGRMQMEINMENPSDIDREWEFHLYCAPCEGVTLPEYELQPISSTNCCFSLNGINMKLSSENIAFRDVTEQDSNFWINFPYNVERSEDPSNPRSRDKKRLKIRTKWISLPARSKKRATIDFLPDSVAETALPPDKFIDDNIKEDELPFTHVIWEAFHNRQYTQSFQNPEQMICRHLPARQWSKFFVWDTGMTAIAMADFNQEYAESIISEMPDPQKMGKDAFGYGSFIITALYALWELYRKTADLKPVKTHYDLLKQLVMHMFDTKDNENYGDMVSANRGTGADDSPALFYAKAEMFAWEYKETLPVNPSHESKSLICIGITAHAIRLLKILRIFADLIGKEKDVDVLTTKIEKIENDLNSHYWSNKHNCYLDRIVDEDNLLEIPWIYDYLPLLSGSVPMDRKEIMLKALFAEDGYFTTNGLTILKPNSPYYRDNGYPNGSIWPPLQYFFWKMCYCAGEMDIAKRIADKFLTLFESNHKESLCVCEHFRANTGKSAGNMRFSSFGTLVAAMWKAHRKYGAIQTSYDILLQKLELNESGADIKLLSPFYSGKTGFSIVLKPNKKYIISTNTNENNYQLISDSNGYLALVINIKSSEAIDVSITDYKE